ncbi:aspartate 1-decarboxylase [candidate division WOR-3 bacterium]|nr:aspartate 1-decarboxylase [candidate division WOR-3 bacterium]
MMVQLCKSKINNAFVTEKNLHYDGSITISEDIARKAHLYPTEKVLVVNVSNGNRFETYVIYGEKGKGIIGLNGGAARKGDIGDELLVLCFGIYDEDKIDKHKMVVIRLKKGNLLPDEDS